MKKLLIVVIFIFLPTTLAFANQPCQPTQFDDGWSGSFPTAKVVSGYMYGLSEQFLWVYFVNGVTSGYANVPLGVGQTIAQTRTPDTYYAQVIQHSYAQVLLSQACGILLAQNGKYLLAQ